MTHDDETLTKLLREGWRGDTATELMREAADRIDRLHVGVEKAATYLDSQFERIRTDEDDDEPAALWVPRDPLFDTLCDLLDTESADRGSDDA